MGELPARNPDPASTHPKTSCIMLNQHAQSAKPLDAVPEAPGMRLTVQF